MRRTCGWPIAARGRAGLPNRLTHGVGATRTGTPDPAASRSQKCSHEVAPHAPWQGRVRPPELPNFLTCMAAAARSAQQPALGACAAAFLGVRCTGPGRGIPERRIPGRRTGTESQAGEWICEALQAGCAPATLPSFAHQRSQTSSRTFPDALTHAPNRAHLRSQRSSRIQSQVIVLYRKTRG